MNLQQAYNFLNFWINKSLGYYYTPAELDMIVDAGQMSLYSDLQTKYATSQRIKDSLSPFREIYTFSTSDTAGGIIQLDPSLNYMDLLDCFVTVVVPTGQTKYMGIVMINEDERAERLNSQVDPVSSLDPFGEIVGVGRIQLYPKVAYAGELTYFRRPTPPVFAYSVVSGRVIVYNAGASTQLEWKQSDINAVLMKALSSVGINITDKDISQFAETKSQQNFMGVNRT